MIDSDDEAIKLSVINTDLDSQVEKVGDNTAIVPEDHEATVINEPETDNNHLIGAVNTDAKFEPEAKKMYPYRRICQTCR